MRRMHPARARANCSVDSGKGHPVCCHPGLWFDRSTMTTSCAIAMPVDCATAGTEIGP